MADTPGGKEPNLELPSFGFGRRRKGKRAEQAPAEEPPPVEETQPIAVADPEPEPEPEPEPAPAAEPALAHEPVREPEPQREPEPEDEREEEPAVREPQRRAERKPFRMPHVPAGLAAFVTGIVTGLVGVGLAYGATSGCEAVRGVGSCGGIGVLALLVVLAVEVVVGAILLKAFRVSDPTSTAFLGVGLVAVLAMLFFLGSIESVWMLLVIPLLTAIAFVLSTILTRQFVETGTS